MIQNPYQNMGEQFIKIILDGKVMGIIEESKAAQFAVELRNKLKNPKY